MQYLAICEDDLLFQFMRNVAAEQGEVLYLVPNETVARSIKRQGGKARQGDLLKEETYRKIKLHHVDQAIVLIRDAQVQERVCRLLRELDKGVSIVSLTSSNGKQESSDPLLRHLMLPDIFQEFCATQLLDTLNIKKVERIRSLFAEGKKIHILLQHDPDPDAIGSALALR
jgi:Trk K+ transport system NAD-binding subunit